MTEPRPPKTVAFTGYRPEKMPFVESPYDEGYRRFRESQAIMLRMLLDRGYTRFAVGMAQGFDTWVAEDVLALKAAHPEWGLSLYCAVPFPGQDAVWPAADRARYRAILARADEVVTVCPAYSRDCYFIRNRHMVDMADVLIAAYDGKRGGTQYTVRYAYGKGLRVICIHPETGKRLVYGE